MLPILMLMLSFLNQHASNISTVHLTDKFMFHSGCAKVQFHI